MSLIYYHYRVTDCCNGSNVVDIRLTVDPATPDPTALSGVYTWDGANYLVPGGTGLFEFITGKCYIFEFIALTGSPFPYISDSSITAVVLGKFADCTAAAGLCPDCGAIDDNEYIKAEPCCGGPAIFFRGEPYIGGNQGGSMPSFSLLQYNGVQQYNIVAPPVQGYPLVPGDCYTWSVGTVGDGTPGAPANTAEYNLLFYPPDASADIQFIHPDDCTYSDSDIGCPICEKICYLLTSCDGTQLQTTIEDFAPTVGTYVTLQGSTDSWYVEVNEGVCTDPVLTLVITGFGVDPCPCNCYEVISAPGLVTYIDCDGNPQSTYAPDKFCAQSPPLAKEVPDEPSAVIINRGPCEEGACIDRCFELINCEPTKYPNQNAIITSTLQSLFQYLNPSSVVELAGYDGCWTVTEATCLCVSLNINGITYLANYSGSTHNGSKVFALEVLGVTYYIWANTAVGSWIISQTVGSTIVTQVLAEIKGGVPNCPIADETVWVKGVLPDGSPVTEIVSGECSDELSCNCPVDVTVLQEYTNCQECVGTIAYKLTNCETGEVTYSIQDLSAYVDKVIKDDCNCWVVEQINYQPPSHVTISNIIEFTDCPSCLAVFYKLTPCDREHAESIIITPSNLSPYLNQVVQVEGCIGCYTVELYEGVGQPPSQQPVEVTVSFETCLDCETLVTRCSTVFNTTTEDQNYSYIDINGNSVSTEIVPSGKASLRHCVQKWDDAIPGIFNYYGDCSVFEVVGAANGCDCVNVSIEGEEGASFIGTANWNGATNDGKNVYSFEIVALGTNITYYIWYSQSPSGWFISQTVGIIAPTDLGSFDSNEDCPIFTDAQWIKGVWPDGQDIVLLETVEGEDCTMQKSKIGECPQYFPNNRKVKPGYNTPICSSQKYDKITCNFAEIAYKEALALRYGISNCCPELDEKWLISKELIELQALNNPQFSCPKTTNSCGKTGSNSSCNS